MAIRIPRKNGDVALYHVHPDSPGYRNLAGHLLIAVYTAEEIALADTLRTEAGSPYYWVTRLTGKNEWFQYPEEAARVILREACQVSGLFGLMGVA